MNKMLEWFKSKTADAWGLFNTPIHHTDSMTWFIATILTILSSLTITWLALFLITPSTLGQWNLTTIIMFAITLGICVGLLMLPIVRLWLVVIDLIHGAIFHRKTYGQFVVEEIHFTVDTKTKTARKLSAMEVLLRQFIDPWRWIKYGRQWNPSLRPYRLALCVSAVLIAIGFAALLWNWPTKIHPTVFRAILVLISPIIGEMMAIIMKPLVDKLYDWRYKI